MGFTLTIDAIRLMGINKTDISLHLLSTQTRAQVNAACQDEAPEVLEISAIDDTALQGALVYANIISFYTGLFDATHTKGQKTADTYRFNIDGWRESGIRYVYVDIFDYAMNRLTVKVPLEELAAGIR